MQNRSKYYLEWFGRADEDELAMQALLKEKTTPSIICFLAQQLAEKYLKGLMAFYEKNPPKIHDLIDLEKILIPIEHDIGEKLKKHLRQVLKSNIGYYQRLNQPNDNAL